MPSALARASSLPRIGWHSLSNATCLIQASFVLRALRRVKDHHTVLHDSPLLKKTCVRQTVLDKWFPLKGPECGPGVHRQGEEPDAGQ